MASGKDSIALFPMGSSALGVADEFNGYSRLPVSLARTTAWNASAIAYLLLVLAVYLSSDMAVRSFSDAPVW